MMFWDYDTQWGGDRSRSGHGIRRYGHLEFENTEKLLELHAQFSVPACFAVVGAAALPGERPYHDPVQIRRIHEAGHEVGSHAFRHEWLPALDRPALMETLHSSKRALEDCIGSAVTTFVPPFNQPFDYPAGLSFSLSERREVRNSRTGLSDLCEALADSGYRFCRVAYRSIFRRAVERLAARRVDRPEPLRTIRRIHCVRINTPCGFAEPTRRLIESHLDSGGIWVVYGHPHSASDPASQSFAHLTEFLNLVARWTREGRIQCALPRELSVAHALVRAASRLIATPRRHHQAQPRARF
jgi:hypothetical protein